jgi:succinate dehydrogenase hydrophobic anchor subunit
MVYLIKKRFIDILFIALSFIVMFETRYYFNNESIDSLFPLITFYIWVVLGLLVGLHELRDVLLDYTDDKRIAKKLILISRIIIWGMIVYSIIYIKDLI